MQQSPCGDYYYGNEAEQYTFYRLPKVLFTEVRYRPLSDSAKILYGLMLDRMGLSVKNGWLDEQNRVYIYFTLEDVQEHMRCGQDKALKLLAELDERKGVGLIERVKQGQGKPAKIYLKKFIAPAEVQTSKKPRSGLPQKPKSAIADSPMSKTPNFPSCRPPKNRGLDVDKTECNKNYRNNTDFNDTQSIYPNSGVKTAIDRIDGYRALIKDNIEYVQLTQNEPFRKKEIDELVEIMTDAVTSTKDYLSIGGEPKPSAIVTGVLLKLNAAHIEYVMEQMSENTTEIRNIRGYLLTTLYNAPATINHHYQNRVNHDLYDSG